MAVDRILQLLGALLAATLVRGLAVLAAAFAVTVLMKRSPLNSHRRCGSNRQW